MSRRQRTISWTVVLGSAVCVALTLSMTRAQQKSAPSPEALLPADALVYAGWDGLAAHRKAWEATAAHRAVFETGLDDVVLKLIQFAGQQAGSEQALRVSEMVDHVVQRGASLAIAVNTKAGPPLPRVTIVVHGAAAAAPQIGPVLRELAGRGGPEFKTTTTGSRTVTRAPIPDAPPGMEIGWWAEGEHLVIAAGADAVNATLAIATGKAPNLRENKLFAKLRAKASFETAFVQWVDIEGIRKLISPIPVPANSPDKQMTVGAILKTLGLDGLNSFSLRWGFQGASLWSEMVLDAPVPRNGLLSLLETKPLDLKELPPLPTASSGFYAWRQDGSKLFNVLAKLAAELARDFAPPDAPPVEAILDQAPRMLGFDPRTELLDTLGDLGMLYSDSRQGLFGVGLGLVIKVKDAPTLRKTLVGLLKRLGAQAGRDLAIKHVDKSGRDIVLFEFPQAPIITPALTVDDNWLVVGLSPQTVTSFLMRLDGQLPQLDLKAAVGKELAELPQNFTAINVHDPRDGLRTFMGLAPAMLSFAQMGMRQSQANARDQNGQPVAPVEWPVSAADFPPVEAIVAPLFVNIGTTTVDDTGVRWTSRTSLPAIPFVDGLSVGGGATTPVLVALLLPAVQQARTAARRAQSTNNLKQLALSLHIHHDATNHMPAAAHPNEKLKTEKRLSWLAEVLPYIDQGAAFNRLALDKAWDDPANAEIAALRMPLFLNPGLGDDPKSRYGVTHYAAMAGVGKDAATLKITDKKAGAFGYDRGLRFLDVTDGTSNTIGAMEVNKDVGPWIAAGRSTLRSLTAKPYINGPDGLGGATPAGMNVLMLDGSVRFISRDVDPSVLEAMSTIAGGEVVNSP